MRAPHLLRGDRRVSFRYPLVAVPEAGQKESLHYYWFKYKKRPPNRTLLRLDSNGIAMLWMRTTGVVCMPGFIAMHAMSWEESRDIRTINDDPTSRFSEKQMADMIAPAGVSLDEMRAQLKKAFDVVRVKRPMTPRVGDRKSFCKRDHKVSQQNLFFQRKCE